MEQVTERVTWKQIQDIVYPATGEKPSVETLDEAGEVIRGILGTRLPWSDHLERWLTAQGLVWDELDDKRMAVMVFLQDHREKSFAPKLVQVLTRQLQKTFCISGNFRQPLARFDLENLLGETIREYVIHARGPLCYKTGLDGNAQLVDVAQPREIAKELCGATMRAAIRLGSPGVCWCSEHVTEGGEGFEPLPSDSRSLDWRALRAAVAAIDALTFEEVQDGGKPPAEPGKPIRLELQTTESGPTVPATERAEPTADGE